MGWIGATVGSDGRPGGRGIRILVHRTPVWRILACRILACWTLACLVWAVPAATPARAYHSYFASRCAVCHYHMDDTSTCNGCHHHAGTLSATADQGQYRPGDPVTVTLSGGTQTGWIRALLYDQNGTEIDRRSGPSGSGDDGQGNPVVFPVTLHGIAPGAPGDYTWEAAWWGNINDGGSSHAEIRTHLVIHVAEDPSAAPGPGLLKATWGRMKRLFRH